MPVPALLAGESCWCLLAMAALLGWVPQLAPGPAGSLLGQVAARCYRAAEGPRAVCSPVERELRRGLGPGLALAWALMVAWAPAPASALRLAWARMLAQAPWAALVVARSPLFHWLPL